MITPNKNNIVYFEDFKSIESAQRRMLCRFYRMFEKGYDNEETKVDDVLETCAWMFDEMPKHFKLYEDYYRDSFNIRGKEISNHQTEGNIINFHLPVEDERNELILEYFECLATEEKGNLVTWRDKALQHKERNINHYRGASA